jgi:hypothetical protein
MTSQVSSFFRYLYIIQDPVRKCVFYCPRKSPNILFRDYPKNI